MSKVYKRAKHKKYILSGKDPTVKTKVLERSINNLVGRGLKCF